jgi:YHS domain-containing protein
MKLIACAALAAIAAGIATTSLASAAFSAPEKVESRAYLHNYNLPSSGIALEGYCPVAYFAADRAILGKPEHASVHDGVTYHFVSGDAKEAFDADPEKYLPSFGGWCAFGMAVEDKFPVDPTRFKIVDGRLLLFLRNPGVDALKLWNDGDEKQLLRKATAHWSKVKA